MKTIKLFGISLFLLAVSPVSAQQPVREKNLKTEINGFIENKGQVTDQAGNVRSDLLFMYDDNGFKLQLKTNSFSYEFWIISGPEEKPSAGGKTERTFLINRVDITLAGANKYPVILKEQQSGDHSNYFLAHTGAEGVRDVRSFRKITYKNIYPFIDLVFYVRGNEGEKQQLKYDFVVHSGGKVSDIKMEYRGAESLRLSKENKLVITTGLGQVREEIPLSYTCRNDSEVKHEEVDFQLKDDQLSFSVGNYDLSKTLVIDPTLIWGTYYGGSSTDFAYEGSWDSAMNSYFAGFTYSSNSIATTGAYQTSFAGFRDVFLVKFGSDKNRKWATYFGGTEEEDASSLHISGNGNIVIAGSTLSPNGISSSGSHQGSLGGKNDAYIAVFSSSGALQWSTYYGGGTNDHGNAVRCDKNNNIYLAGHTASTNAIAAGSPHQSGFGGNQDAFLAKFNSAGVLQWGTYFGGAGIDGAWALFISDTGKIFVAGETSSVDSIASSGAYQTAFAGGNSDVFLARFNSGGIRQWATYYGGTGTDISYGLNIDASGNILSCGKTSSSTGISTSGTYQPAFQGSEDAFAVKFSASGSRTWGTYFGGSSVDIATELATDSKNHVFVCGYTPGGSGLTTAGAWQSVHGGYDDVFILRLDSTGQRKASTYYGGSGYDYGQDIDIVNDEYLLLAGHCNSPNNISTPGSYKPSLSAGSFSDAIFSWFSKNVRMQEPAQVTNVFITNVTTTEMTVKWTKGSGNRSLVVGRLQSVTLTTPADGMEYNSNNNFSDGMPVGTSNFAMYAGTGDSVRVSGLIPGTLYSFTVYSYNSHPDSAANYKLPGVSANKFTLFNEPDTSSKSLLFTNVSQSSMMLKWTKGNGQRRIVIAREGASVDSVPADGTGYTANSGFGLGSSLGNGYVVYDGTDTFFTVTQLQPSAFYHFAIIEYNGSGTSSNYFSSSVLSGDQNTLAEEPAFPSTNLTFTNVGSNSMKLGWTKGGGKNHIVIVRESMHVNEFPLDGVAYPADTIFGNGSQLDSANFVVYQDQGNSFTLTGLKPSTIYHAAVIEMNGEGDSANYRISTYLSGSRPTLAKEPLLPSSNITFSDISTDSLTVTWTKGSGQRSLVVVKGSFAVNRFPADGISYTQNTGFGSGSDLGAGNFVVYKGSGNTFRLRLLDPNTEYHVAIFELSGDGDSSNYLTTAYAMDSSYTLATAQITPGGSTTFCNGDSVRLNAFVSANAAYSWRLNGSLIPAASDSFLYVKDSGDYMVYVSNAAGTNNSAAVRISVNMAKIPLISILNPASFYCDGDTIKLQVIADPGKLKWNTGDTLSILPVSQSGSYSVTLTATNGCKATSAVTNLTVNQNPPVPVITQSGDTLISSQAFAYQWNGTTGPISGADQRTFVPQSNGKYTVTVFNSAGCRAGSQEFNYIKTGTPFYGNELSFTIYPNPAHGTFSIQTEDLKSLPCSLKIHHISGQVMLDNVFENGKYLQDIRPENAAPGLYFITIMQGNNIAIRKLILY